MILVKVGLAVVLAATVASAAPAARPGDGASCGRFIGDERGRLPE